VSALGAGRTAPALEHRTQKWVYFGSDAHLLSWRIVGRGPSGSHDAPGM